MVFSLKVCPPKTLHALPLSPIRATWPTDFIPRDLIPGVTFKDMYCSQWMHAVARVVEALRGKPEGRGFRFLMVSFVFVVPCVYL